MADPKRKASEYTCETVVSAPSMRSRTTSAARDRRQRKPRETPVVDRGGNGAEHATVDLDQAVVHRAGTNLVDREGTWLRGKGPPGCIRDGDYFLYYPQPSILAAFRADAAQRTRKSTVSTRNRVVRCAHVEKAEAKRTRGEGRSSLRYERMPGQQTVDRRTPPRSHDKGSGPVVGQQVWKRKK